MRRTSVAIDRELLARVMRMHGLRTKQEAIDFALRRVAGEGYDPQKILELEGIGWIGNL